MSRARAAGQRRRAAKAPPARRGRRPPLRRNVRHPEIASRWRGAAANVRRRVQFSTPRNPELITWPATPVAANGLGGAVLVLHDITDLRRADQIRRDFVANVSHELRTPLTAVRGYVEALTEGDGSGRKRRFLEIIGRHTLRMERLVKDLLRLARLDAGQETLEHVSCALEALFGGVTTELASSIEIAARHHGHDRGDAATVTGDPSKLHDALRNLVENATSYSPERSDITGGGSPRDHMPCRLRYRAGNPRRGLPRVFERFYRVDKSARAAPATRRNGPRPRDRQASGRTARRQGDGGESPRRRCGADGGVAGLA